MTSINRTLFLPFNYFLFFFSFPSKLYYTTDLGRSFNLLQSHVKSFMWSSIEGFPIHLYVERREPTSKWMKKKKKKRKINKTVFHQTPLLLHFFLSLDTSSIIFIDASNLLKNGEKKFNLLIENVQEFYIKKDFMFATQKILNSTIVLISYKRGRFVKADFQTELDIKVSQHEANIFFFEHFINNTYVPLTLQLRVGYSHCRRWGKTNPIVSDAHRKNCAPVCVGSELGYVWD